MTIRTIDAHVAGEALRLVIDGFPSPRGRTMADKQQWLEQHADSLRRTLVYEPRGHRDLSAAILTEPVTPHAHAGVIMLDQAGFGTMPAEGIIAVTTIALERSLIVSATDSAILTFDTVTGAVRATPTRVDGHVVRVSMAGPAAAVLHGALAVPLGHRLVRVDVAASGALYGLVDGEAVGLPVDVDHVSDLRGAAEQIITALDALPSLVHPTDAAQTGVAGVVFTAPARDVQAGLKSVTVTRAGQVNRSPSANAIAAIMTVLDAMGVIGPDDRFVAEGLIGTHLTGRMTGRTVLGEHPALMTEIEGTAWITGEHAFTIDPGDPLKDGFRV